MTALSRPAATPSPMHRFRDVGWRHVFAVLVCLYAIFPIVVIVSAAFRDSGTLVGSNRLFESVSLNNLADLNSTMFWTWVRNTIGIAVVTAIGTVLLGAAAAYAFSRFRFRGRRGTLISLLIIQMFPQILAFVALFLLLTALGKVVPILGLNSHLGLVMVYLGGALGVNTFLMYGFFNTVPREIDEAAKIDGATHAQIFWALILRLTAPILVVVGLLSIIGTVSDFVLPKVILQSQEKWTIAVGLFQFVSETNNSNWGVFAIGSVIAATPIVILFLFLQRYIVSGLTAGAVKG
ncbi:binding-protein-dependent transport systems inner membrane component [Beutenbergia cavernae DSM 12333]|uniref:Binding-protein-dependent transport systems inner membrane component n=1 Tax=Beutenbergia cavernae (strain ATCC BAA-8 / DSM 12333 / CCUG 43141 / JCM 11478 / NBRC 16432 / NCIMB 13614 / HKI 0122) TaxID=471853 RepID=C5C2Q3_BEUC1|nr:ABC transporter permease subunit [Beutenbergia cavernae]ACQ79739.1 binding-protein-dependent transport systems inner membrane component [Beutenbergia cavernae DSM 12333]